ncbi:hypothetical protein [Niveispirillum lacus]|nr:hypothetical protein [Niveispirillum lacus]
MQSSIPDNQDPPDFIEKIANRAGQILLGSVALIIAVWTFYFSVYGELPAGKPDVWGQFGDFVGGTLNSIFAFFSFMILIASLRLQVKELRLTREELALTRKELAATSQSHNNQVRHLQREAEKKDLIYSIEFILGQNIIDRINFVIVIGTGRDATTILNLMDMNFPTRAEVDQAAVGTYDTDCFFKELHALHKLDRDCAALQCLLADAPLLKCAKERYREIVRRLIAKGWTDGWHYLNQ